MSKKKYIIEVDTRLQKAKKDFEDLEKIIRKAADSPASLQKSVYNALNQTNKAIVKSKNDFDKLGDSVNVLGHKIKSAFDLSKGGNLSKEISGLYKSISTELSSAIERSDKFNKQFQQLSKTSINLRENFQSFQTTLTSNSAAMKQGITNIDILTKGTINATNRVLQASSKVKDFSGSLENLAVKTVDSSKAINEINNRIAALSPKAKNAKENLIIIRSELARLIEIKKGLKELSLDVRGIKQAQAVVQSLRHSFVENIQAIRANRKVLTDLENKYNSAANQLTAFRQKQQELAIALKSFQASGTNLKTNSIEQRMKELSVAINTAEKQLLKYRTAIDKVNQSNMKLKAQAQSIKGQLSQSASLKDINPAQLAATQNKIVDLDLLTKQSMQSAMAARTLNLEMMKSKGVFRIVGSNIRGMIYDLNALRIAFILLSSSTGILAATKVLGDFDKSMSRARALMIGAGEATSLVNIQFASLKQVVQNLGAVTKFTAGEVAEGAVILTQAGYDAVQSMEILKPVLDLAVAGQIDMKESADTLAKSLAMFGKSAGDASHVADLYSAAINYSQTNMTELATAMTYVGAVSRTFGLSLEETASYLAVLANNGISASKAGTSLRQLMLNIKKPTANAAKILNALNLNFYELTKNGMSAEQALRHILVKLKEAGKMSHVVRVTALPAAEILGSNYEQIGNMIDRLTDSLDGYASKVAENTTQNLVDQFIQLRSAVQDTIIRLGDITGFTSGLTSLFKNSADALREWNVDMKHLVTSFLTLVGVVIGAKSAFSSYSSSVNELGQRNNVALTSMQNLTNKYNTFNKTIIDSGGFISAMNNKLSNLGKSALLFGSNMLALSAQMAVITGVFYGLGRAIDYLLNMRNLEDVLNDHVDMFNVAKSSAEDYSKALEAVSISASKMSTVQLNYSVSKLENDIKIMEEGIIKSLRDLRQQATKEMITMWNFLDKESTEALHQLSNNISHIDFNNLLEEGDLGEIVADVDQNALSLPFLEGIEGVRVLLQDLSVLKDKLEALTTEKTIRLTLKADINIDKYIKDFEKLQELSRVDKNIFAYSDPGVETEIAKLKPLVMGEEYKKMLDKIAEAEGGLDLVQNIEWVNGKLSYRNDLLEEQAELSKRIAEYSANPQAFGITDEELEKLKQFHSEITGLIIELDNLNESAGSLTFWKVMEDAVKKIDLSEMKEQVEDLLDLRNVSVDWGDKFKQALGTDFMMEGKKLDILKEPLKISTNVNEITVAGQKLEDYIEKQRRLIDLEYQSGAVTQSVWEKKTKYIDYLQQYINYAIKAASDKTRNKKGRKDEDLTSQYYRSKIAVAEMVDGLKKEYEEKLKIHEIDKKMSDLRERYQGRDVAYYGKLMQSLAVQKEVLKAQLSAETALESKRKGLSDTGSRFGAVGLDASVLDLRKQELNLISQQMALEEALNNKKISSNKEVVDNMKAQVELSQELLASQQKIRQEKLNQEWSNVSIKLSETIDSGFFGVWERYAHVVNIANSEMKMLDLQIQEVNNSLAQLNATEENTALRTELEMRRQILEITKQQIESDMIRQNPTGWQGASNAFEAYSKKVSNDALVMEEVVTSSLNTIESGLTDGLFAALTQVEYRWDQFFANLSKIFLEGFIQMTIMKGLAKLGDLLSDALGGGESEDGSGSKKKKKGGGWESILSNLLGSLIGGFTKSHASGGIIKRPTAIMGNDGLHRVGEAGAEAILPVERLANGKYGIETSGAAGGVMNQNDFSVHVNVQGGSSGDEEKDKKFADDMAKQISTMVDMKVSQFMKNEMRPGGMLARK